MGAGGGTGVVIFIIEEERDRRELSFWIINRDNKVGEWGRGGEEVAKFAKVS